MHREEANPNVAIGIPLVLSYISYHPVKATYIQLCNKLLKSGQKSLISYNKLLE